MKADEIERNSEDARMWTADLDFAGSANKIGGVERAGIVRWIKRDEHSNPKLLEGHESRTNS